MLLYFSEMFSLIKIIAPSISNRMKGDKAISMSSHAFFILRNAAYMTGHKISVNHIKVVVPSHLLLPPRMVDIGYILKYSIAIMNKKAKDCMSIIVFQFTH